MVSFRNYLELTKPRITCFILMSTGVGFLCAVHLGCNWTWLSLLHTLLGTGLMASGTAALNQWYEREADAKMARTKKRPIPSGRVKNDASPEGSSADRRSSSSSRAVRRAWAVPGAC